MTRIERSSGCGGIVKLAYHSLGSDMQDRYETDPEEWYVRRSEHKAFQVTHFLNFVCIREVLHTDIDVL